jgi:AAA-like domain
LEQANRSNSLNLSTRRPHFPRGQVPLTSPFYIDRQPIESRCQEIIQKPGTLLLIKAPKEMGKTSFLARVLANARKQDYLTVTLSLRSVDKSIFLSLERFLKWFCDYITQSLGLPNRLEEQWNEIFGSNYNAIDYFEKCILSNVEKPLVIALDDMDIISQNQEIFSDFSGLLRAMHERSKGGYSDGEKWSKLRIILTYSILPNRIQSIHQSPFNIGFRVKLPEFTASQILDLAQRYQLDLDDKIVDQLIDFVGGHPRLIHQALYLTAYGEFSVAELIRNDDAVAYVYDDYLSYLWDYLQKWPDLMSAFIQVIHSSEPVWIDTNQEYWLKELALVHLHNSMATPSCQLYSKYFRDRLHNELFLINSLS